jgi:hypothetical protein
MLVLRSFTISTYALSVVEVLSLLHAMQDSVRTAGIKGRNTTLS